MYSYRIWTMVLTISVKPTMTLWREKSKMAEVIGVSEAQLRFVTNTQSGMGLMKCGNVVIPFDNTIEKGTDLYNLYNTNIHEKIAMEKNKNAVDND